MITRNSRSSKSKRASRQTAKTLLTRQQLAKVLDVTPRTILRWKDDGMPVARRGGKGRPFLFNEARVLAWKAARDEAAAQAVVSSEHEHARKERAQAMLAEQTYRVRERDLIPRQEIERVLSQHISGERNIWLALDRHADTIYRAGVLGGVSAVEQALREIAHKSLERLAAGITLTKGAA